MSITNTEGLEGSLQINVAALAVFSDTGAPVVRASVDASLFTSRVYRDIITRTYTFFDAYKRPPKEHIADELEDLMSKGDEHGEMLKEVVQSLYELYHDKERGFTDAYVLADLERFVRQQSLKVGVVEAHSAIQVGDLDGAESAMHRAMKARSASFTPGITLLEGIKLLSNPDTERDTLTLGVKELDRLRLGPAKKELHLFIGPPKAGKSWWLIWCAKRALMQNWKGVYITLELSERLVARRMIQAIFALKTRDDAEINVPHLVLDDETGKLISIEMAVREKIASIDGHRKIGAYAKRIEAQHLNNKIRIKEFPTGSLTVHGIEAYLDLLDSMHGFIPDFICLDYADLMTVSADDNYRLSLGELYKNLRGLAVERGLALITASQSNRFGAGARLVQATDVAEDFSKIGTADCVITYTATPHERRRGLARLYVAAGRVEADKFTTIITQSYGSGQFVRDSYGMFPEYWTFLPKGDEDSGGTGE